MIRIPRMIGFALLEKEDVENLDADQRRKLLYWYVTLAGIQSGLLVWILWVAIQ